VDIQSAILNGGGIDAIASELGISPAIARSGAGALLPAILGGFKSNAQAQPEGLAGLESMLGGLGGGALLQSVLGAGPTDVGTGNNILGAIFGSRDVSRTVADHAAGQTGVDTSLLRRMLPMLAMLVAGYLATHAGGGQATPQQDAPAGGGLGGMLGGVLGGLLGGGAGEASQPQAQPQPQAGAGGLGSMLDMDGDGNPLNDILGMAGRLAGR
jgi:hypothetical protein